MRILYVNAIETNRGWGAECFVSRGLKALGHDPLDVDYRRHRRHLSQHFRDVGDFDILFLQRAEGFPLALVRAVRRPRVFWASELVARCRDQDPLLRSGLFDHVFVHTAACRRAVTERGWLDASNVSVLLNGFSPQTHRQAPDATQDIDVLFVGSITPRRSRILDRLAQRFPVVVKQAYGEEMVRLFNRAKIVLNIHAEEELDTETRVFEALACGAFLLSEPLSEDSPFVPGQHLVEVDREEDLEDEIEHRLADAETRTKIAAAGHREAVERHSYDARAEEIAARLQRLVDAHQSAVDPLDPDRLAAYERTEPIVWGAWKLRSVGSRVWRRARGLLTRSVS